MKGDKVETVEGRPGDYHCDCQFCQGLAELRPPGGGYYSRLERRQYYDPLEQGKEGHIAKTPLHVARWAVQQYTKKGDWVLDPTIGAGTTAVEAITQGRSVAGMELQYGEILSANVKKNLPLYEPTFPVEKRVAARLRVGDARNLAAFLDSQCKGIRFSLVINNPPYSGDEHAGIGKTQNGHATWTTSYAGSGPNLAFLKEGKDYWDALANIYAECAGALRPGGRFVVAVKDMMRNKEPFLLHRDLGLLLSKLGLEHERTALLKHHPTTLFLNTYHKFYGVHPPYYQTILVFRRRGGRRP